MFGKKRSPEDDVKKLSRTELLEMLIEETREAEALRAQNEKMEAELVRLRADLDRTASLEVLLKRLERIAGVEPAAEAEGEESHE